MSSEPCSVCGGTELNLVDGFYYCVECGTQDVNAQETVVEHTVLADGTFAHAASRKVTTVLKDGVEMSGEWHKWHTFNFILSGLVDEVVALGGSAEFKAIALWIWTRYMKKFVNKELMGTENEVENKDNLSKSRLFESEDSDLDMNDNNKKPESGIKEKEGAKTSIKFVTKSLLLSIIYIALNFDKSDIQLSHLCRFMREGRISLHNFKKFIPKGMNLKSIPNWRSFMSCTKQLKPLCIREVAMTLIKRLDLGKPVVPDLRKLVDNYTKELCLPNDFKTLVFSLMYEFPYIWDYVHKRYNDREQEVRIPDYEGVTMAYMIVALKMSFGLDDDYEIKLSSAVEKINENEKRLKSYRLGMYPCPTDRLFSFREWCNFMQFRKTMLCKYCLLMAIEYELPVDDQVFMGQLEERQKKTEKLADEVTMDILNRLQINDEAGVIPRSEFSPSVTPLSSYTEVIGSYMQDPELKLLLCEDFSQYSLKYACEDFNLLIDNQNVVLGVSENNKTISEVISASIDCKESDFSMVFVRNCENRHWLTTKPPTLDHLTKIDENDDNSKDSDHGYDSNLENDDLKSQKIENSDIHVETIDEEKGVSIFDDDFKDVSENSEEKTENDSTGLFPNYDMPDNDMVDNEIVDHSFTQAQFDPETFDREGTIKELILHACKTHKIPIPKEYKESTKRKSNFIRDEAGGSKPKRKRTEAAEKRSENKTTMNRIMSAYYANLQNDFISKATSQIMSSADKSVVDNFTSFRDSIVFEDDPHYENIRGSEEIEENKDITAPMEAENQSDNEADELMPKVNPEFDDKTHDVSQLYVKFKNNFTLDDFLESLDDPELDKIIEKKIEETEINEPVAVTTDQVTDEIVNDSDSEDEDNVPLSRIASEKALLESRNSQEESTFDDLIQNHENLTSFKYWFRHYNDRAMAKTKSIKDKFDRDLKNNCSISFNFVISECASMLDVTAFSLYKLMQNLEQKFEFHVNNFEEPKRKHR